MGKPSTTIRIQEETRDSLWKIKRRDETYDDLIKKMLAARSWRSEK